MADSQNLTASDGADDIAKEIAERRFAVLRSVVETPGTLDPSLRYAIFARACAPLNNDSDPDCPEGLPTLLCAFVDKIFRDAHNVTDGDIARLKDAGYSEDAIYETIVCAAAGAGLVRQERGLDAAQL